MIQKLDSVINTLVYKMEFKKLVVFILSLFIFGIISNHYFKHRFFYVNQGILLFMLVAQIFVLRTIEKQKNGLINIIEAAHESEVIGIWNKMNKIAKSKIIKFISITLVLLYIFAMFHLKCVERTITGTYGGLLGAFVFYIGIKAYLQYILLVYFTYDIRNVKINTYSFYLPSLTDWIRKLAQIFSLIEKWFLLLGILYSLIYAINLPTRSIYYNNGIIINTPNNNLFILTWVGILVLFGFACPALSFISRNYIKVIIQQLKAQSINQIHVKNTMILNAFNANNMDDIEKKLSLIKEIDNSSDYPLNFSQTIFDSVYAIVTAVITLASPFMSIIEAGVFKINP